MKHAHLSSCSQAQAAGLCSQSDPELSALFEAFHLQLPVQLSETAGYAAKGVALWPSLSHVEMTPAVALPPLKTLSPK